ncbi:MAG: AMP-binding protein [Pseudomonadota bacterium]|nr:AMP-binding protein [Pseudomonadota bacterium]
MLSFLFDCQRTLEEVNEHWLHEPFIYLDNNGLCLTRWEILQVALQVNQSEFNDQQSEIKSAIILFQQRHYFLISLLSIALSNGRAILPPNLTAHTLQNLINQNSNLNVFSDTLPEELQEQEHINSEKIDQVIEKVKSNQKRFDQKKLVEILSSILDAQIWLYTSGSTGAPKKVIKTWKQMFNAAELAIERFNLMQPCNIIATVPSQHMFGLETTIFWPLLSKASIWHERPIFPEDILSAVQVNEKNPALLVSTPLHLNKIQAFDLTWPKGLERILSATAPLSTQLAKKLEQNLQTRVYEVYGSTETASIASRETTHTLCWKPYRKISFIKLKNQGYAVSSPGIESIQPLHDNIELLDDNHHFILGQRDTDLIKIAGKRASLTELNHHMQTIKGITEGSFFYSENSKRLTLFIVSQLTRHDILMVLRQLIDPAFLPRPIIFVEKLPRNNVGKILYSELSALLKS